jgi:hypothetical protein
VRAGPGRPPTGPSGEPLDLSTRDPTLAAALARAGYAFTTGLSTVPAPLRSIGVAHDGRDEMERHPIHGRDVIVGTEERVGV